MDNQETINTISYGDIELWKVEMSIDYRINELKKKVVDKTITKEEIEELKLLSL